MSGQANPVSCKGFIIIDLSETFLRGGAWLLFLLQLIIVQRENSRQFVESWLTFYLVINLVKYRSVVLPICMSPTHIPKHDPDSLNSCIGSLPDNTCNFEKHFANRTGLVPE
jgi:hypothetical protein